MSDPIITVEQLGKLFHLNRLQQHTTLRDALVDSFSCSSPPAAPPPVPNRAVIRRTIVGA